ncbi:MAG: zinc-binding dehydrogenase [Anaerolineae bacterium]|nr:zinc-binding dehydrogenase [Anaerolineae bacterium]
MPTRAETMKAGLLESSEEFVVREVPVPVPGTDEVLIRVRACGVCMSEVASWKSGRRQPRYPRYPEVLNVLDWDFPVEWRERDYPVHWGHEMSGEIVEVGEGVADLRSGVRVAGLGSRGFAEYCLCPARYTLPLDATIPFTHALGEPIAAAYNAARRATIQPGDSVALVGCGFMGLMLLQMVRLAAPRVVVALDIRDDALDTAHRLGADAVINVAREDVYGRLREVLGPRGADVTIEVAGKQETLDLAGCIAAVRGRVVIAGCHQGGPRSVDVEHWNYKVLDVINAHARDPQVYFDGMRAGIRLLSEGKLRMDRLITHVFRLDELDTAFRAATEKPHGFIKAVITPGT